MRKTRLRSVASDLWQPTLLTITAILLIGALLFYNLTTLVPALQGEMNATTRSLATILSDPLFIHQQLIQKITFLLTNNELLSIRTPSVLTGVLAALAFYSVVSIWFTRRVALFASLLLVTSGWFLHVTRIGTTDAAYLLPLACVMAAVWLHSRRYTIIAALAFIIIGLTMLYVPGMVWFIVPALIWQRATLFQILRKLQRWQIALGTLLLIIGIAPLLVALAREPSYLLKVAALPNSLQSLKDIPAAGIQVLSDIFVLRQEDPRFGIGRIPHLSIFTTATFALGIFAAFYNRRLDRIKVLLGLLAGGIILASASPAFSKVFLLPPIFLLAAGGIALLLQQWFTVFPKNPLARQVGVVMVFAGILINVLFGLTSYFVAWPHTPATTEALVSSSED